KGLRRLRIGDYRVTYSIEKDSVIIAAIKHRKNAYED
ncbi:MAG: type II toxin-antitoxin system RelE/ParE family toxin, partial [Aliifodinibius sp.]|nr:type II toxin-antitoxin system RelE/ParE family toxin [Fodinibius sp.]